MGKYSLKPLIIACSVLLGMIVITLIGAIYTDLISIPCYAAIKAKSYNLFSNSRVDETSSSHSSSSSEPIVQYTAERGTHNNMGISYADHRTSQSDDDEVQFSMPPIVSNEGHARRVQNKKIKRLKKYMNEQP